MPDSVRECVDIQARYLLFLSSKWSVEEVMLFYICVSSNAVEGEFSEKDWPLVGKTYAKT